MQGPKNKNCRRKDVSDETIKDASEPMQIKWYNTSCIKVPVLRY